MKNILNYSYFSIRSMRDKISDPKHVPKMNLIDKYLFKKL